MKDATDWAIPSFICRGDLILSINGRLLGSHSFKAIQGAFRELSPPLTLKIRRISSWNSILDQENADYTLYPRENDCSPLILRY